MEVWYIDTSALVKLVAPEVETDALVDWMRDRRWMISDLHRTELRRAARRVGPSATARAEQLLQHFDVVTINAEIFDRAGDIGPTGLRSLDAIHLAAALALDADLAGVVTYDDRLAAAAAAHRLIVVNPGSDQ